MEPVIKWVAKRTTSKGDLYEVAFSDDVIALTMDARLGELATAAKGQRARRGVTHRPSKDSRFPASVWLDKLDPLGDEPAESENETPISILPPATSPLRLECLKIAANCGEEGDILILAQAFEDWVLGKKFATVQATRVNEVQTDDIPF